MASITINIPDAIVVRLTAAGRTAFPQYEALTPGALFKKATADYWKAILIEAERKASQETQMALLDAAVKGVVDQAAIDTIGIS